MQEAILITLEEGLSTEQVAAVLQKLDELMLSDERFEGLTHQSFDPDRGEPVIYIP